jgi:hypothetical protein
MQPSFLFKSNLVLPDIYRLDHEAFFYIELTVNIYEAKIAAYSKSYSAKIKNLIFDTITDENEDVEDYDTKINQEKIKLNNKKQNLNLPDTYVKLTYSNIEVCRV